MNVIARSTLNAYAAKHSTAKAPLQTWYAETRRATWLKFADVRATFNTADYVGDGKVVFDLGGNNYRLVGLVGFKAARVFVLWIGTHAEYDKIDVGKL